MNYILEHDGYHVLKKKYLNGMHNTYSYHIFPVRDAASRKLKELRNKWISDLLVHKINNLLEEMHVI